MFLALLTPLRNRAYEEGRDTPSCLEPGLPEWCLVSSLLLGIFLCNKNGQIWQPCNRELTRLSSVKWGIICTTRTAVSLFSFAGSKSEWERERERERFWERERERERERNTHTHTQRERESLREREQERERKRGANDTHFNIKSALIVL